jgi:YHS domain-containing protein
MGLLDRVKQVVGDATEVAKKGATQVQSMVEHTQVRRRADDAAKQLGYLIFLERHGGTPPPAGQVDRLVAEIAVAEAELERAGAADSEGKAVDPVCGMSVDVGTATFTYDHGGTTYYFCSQQCLDRFSKNPTAYVDAPFEGPQVPPPASGQAPEEAAGE